MNLLYLCVALAFAVWAGSGLLFGLYPSTYTATAYTTTTLFLGITIGMLLMA